MKKLLPQARFLKRYDSFQGLGQFRKAAAGKEVFLMLSSLWNKNAFEK